jgi:predicted dehydrogenase
MAIHTFDASRLITGADPVSVYCHEFNPKSSWYRHGASAIVTFEMSDGIVLSYRGSWTAEGLNTSWNSSWHAICEKGSASWDGEDSLCAEKVTPQETGGDWESEILDIPVSGDAQLQKSGHAGPMEDFLKCVREGGVPETAGSDNIKSLAMVFKAIESAEKGEKVYF